MKVPSIITLVLLFTNEIQAFSTAPRTPLGASFSSSFNRNSAKHAIVCGEDGEVISSSLDDDDGGDDKAEGVYNNYLLDSIASQLDTATLTRIACAFAPAPHHNLHPSNAVSAELVSVTRNQVEIAVGIAAGDDSGTNERAVQVLVPVPLDANMSNVLAQLQLKDYSAQHIIAQRDLQKQEADQLDAQERIIQQLQEEALGVDLPNWWTYPELNVKLAEECSSLKKLLNEVDSSKELAQLFQQRYSSAGDSSAESSRIRVIKVGVGSVGPSGIVVRAFCEDLEKEEDRFGIKELAIAFDVPRAVTSANELRSNILRLLESVQEEPSVVEESSAEVAIQKELFQRQLLAAQLRNKRKPATEPDDTTMKERFQQALLAARFQNGRAARMQQQAKSNEAFQRALLAARFQDEQAARLLQLSKTSEAFQRALLATQFQNELAARLLQKSKASEAFQRALLKSTLKNENITRRLRSTKKREAFQRNLLENQILNDKLSAQKALQEMQQARERARRQLLEAILKQAQVDSRKRRDKQREAFQRRLLQSTLKYKSGSGGGFIPRRSPQQDAALAKKYSRIEDVGERAFAILKDLSMV